MTVKDILKNRETVLSVAKEVNAILSPPKAISMKKNDATETILAQCQNAVEGLATTDDFANTTGEPVFSTVAVDVFTALGVVIPTAKPVKKDPATPKTATDILNKKTEKAAKKAAEPKVERFTRSMAVTEAVKKLCVVGATLKEIMAESDAICVSHGLDSNPTATNVNTYMLVALVDFEVLEMTADKKYIFTGLEA